MGEMLSMRVFVLISVVVETRAGMFNIDTRENMWVTWAKQTKQDSFCLSLATPSNPFRTCLIGVPLTSMAEFEFSTPVSIDPKGALGPQAAAIARNLRTAGPEPQEFDLLGSVPGNYCLVFGCFAVNSSLLIIDEQQLKSHDTWLSPHSPLYYNYTEYCNNWVRSVTQLTTAAKRLPPGIFLVCGARAWSTVPPNSVGGPCYFGKLTLFAPSIHQVLGLPQKARRIKRSMSQLGPNCRDQVKLWQPAAVISASVFAPGVASAQALTQLKHLACWTGKQINITTKLLSELAEDVSGIRHSVLQNRAAIDFLLLAQGHGCEEFEGMCCMNLSDHSRSIHHQLAQLRDNMKHLVVENTPFDNWLKSWNLTGWIVDLIRFGIMIFIAVIVVLIIVPCLIQCMRKLASCALTSVWIAQKEKGGTVAEFLRYRGHDMLTDTI
ncbi:uncharacterized protein LOC134565030 [Prinia subflava]|uniref:uncharacterized protein LOC134565030 n=1 Tax=Prinia subflava TaxID=208062 RepID=UPI002FE09BCE